MSAIMIKIIPVTMRLDLTIRIDAYSGAAAYGIPRYDFTARGMAIGKPNSVSMTPATKIRILPLDIVPIFIHLLSDYTLLFSYALCSFYINSYKPNFLGYTF